MHPHTPPLKILKASAGSGKTFSLTVHYLLLLLSGEYTYREMLAVTFTNKATAEMKSRIMEVLEGLARGIRPEGHDTAAAYRKVILEHFAEWDDGLLQLRASAAYRRILHDYGRFSVTTIDGFVQKVIRGFTFELGIDAGYKLEMNLRKVKNDLVIRLNRLLDERPDLLQWIMDYAQACIDRDDNWNYRYTLSELAGELFREHFQDFDQAVAAIPGEELFVSLDRYTKETIRRFDTEFRQMLSSGAEMVVRLGVTAADLNRKSQNYLGKLTALADYDPGEAIGKLDKYIHAPEKRQKGGPMGTVAALYAELNPLLERLRGYYLDNGRNYYMARAVHDNLYYLRLMKEMSSLLAGWRKDNGAQLISDAQILLNRIGMDDAGDPTFIWEKTGQRYRHFLFDEFQDTSRKQWDNFRPLLVNALAAAGGRQTEHLMVGDVKQSIYRWRNGDWRILLDKAEQELAASFHLRETSHLIAHETLEVNFRSRATIVTFNNLLFRYAPVWVQHHINKRVEDGLNADLYQAWWREAGNHDTVSRAYDGSGQRLPEGGRPGGTVDVYFLPVESNQHRATAIAEAALVQLYDTLTNWISEGRYQPGQVGILVRTNAEARAVMQYLLGKQVSFEVISADALLVGNHTAVRLLVSTLYAITAQTQAQGYYLALSAYLYQQIAGGEGLSPDAWMQAGSGDAGLLRGVLPDELLDNRLGWQQVPLAELIEILIRIFCLDRQETALPYLFVFRDQVASFTAAGEKGIQAFLTYWEEEGHEASLPAGATHNAVEVITIHKSKGLAYDVVMVPFCSWELDGRPNSNVWVDTAGTPYALLNRVPVKYKSELSKSALFKAYYEEMLFSHMDALNALYVAFTRAREHLYVTAPGRVEGKDVKNPLVADVLWEVLQEQAETLGVSFNEGICLGAAAADDHKTGTPIAGGWCFDRYPLSGNVRQLLTSHVVQRDLDMLGREKAMRQGQIVHELIAVSETLQQVAHHAGRMAAEGRIAPDEQDEILELATRTLNHPGLGTLLTGNYELKTEQSIILADGSTLRPDKVLIGKEEVMVLDFKFTKERSGTHSGQVRMYKEVLHRLGYLHVKGYIFYGFQGELIEV